MERTDVSWSRKKRKWNHKINDEKKDKWRRKKINEDDGRGKRWKKDEEKWKILES